MEICKLIIELVDEKNPPDWNENTPLHKAAENGHKDVCRLIIENVNNKLPVNSYGKTPKDLADEWKDPEFSQLFM